jgi:hypothetical protein
MRKVAFRMGVIDSLELGSLTVRELPVMVMPDRELEFKFLFLTLLKIDAIIGWPLISRFRTTLDYRVKEIRFQRSAPNALAMSRNLFFMGQPYIAAAIDSSGPLHFILDTGAMVSMITPDGFAKLVTQPRLVSAPGCIGGAGGSDAGRVKTIRDATLTVAGKTIYPAALAIHKLPTEGMLVMPDGLCGEDILKHFVVTIDPQNGVLTVEQ